MIVTWYRPAVCGGATRVASYEGGGLAHASGRGDHTFLCVGARHWAGPGGDEETLRVVLTSAAAEVAAAGVTEAAALQSAHQALRDHLVETLPMLFGNEDSGKHCGITQTITNWLEKLKITCYHFSVNPLWSLKLLHPNLSRDPRETARSICFMGGQKTLMKLVQHFNKPARDGLCCEITAAVGKSAQNQWQLTAIKQKRRELSVRVTSGRKHSTPPDGVFHPLIWLLLKQRKLITEAIWACSVPLEDK